MYSLSFKKYFLSKKFSTFTKVNFKEGTGKYKNLLYFVTDSDVNTTNEPIINFLKINDPMRYQDLKKNKISLLYAQNDTIFSERCLVINTPTSDINKLRGVTSKALRSILPNKLDEITVQFSQTFPIHHRRVVINSLLLTNYSWKIAGDVKEETDEENDPIITPIKKFIGAEVTSSEIKNKTNSITRIEIILDKAIKDNLESFQLWINMAYASLYTRTLANQRANVGNCNFLEQEARDIAKSSPSSDKIKIEIIKGDELVKKGLNLIHAVGKSSQEEPRLIILSYIGNPEEKKISHAIVGKGITFDTGGLNLKPTGYMEDMYLDKHGACNALAVFKTIAEMKLPINIVSAIAVAENSIDGTSYRPSDIIKSHKGYTVEITNTDAEGRLVLADALSYVQDNYKPEHIVDLATLTGACMVALGHKTAGLFTNDSKFASDIVEASSEVGETVWHLPLNDEHRDGMKSEFADIKNSEKGRYGGASKGAAFLEKFINKGTKWVHLDIAG